MRRGIDFFFFGKFGQKLKTSILQKIHENKKRVFCGKSMKNKKRRFCGKPIKNKKRHFYGILSLCSYFRLEADYFF